MPSPAAAIELKMASCEGIGETRAFAGFGQYCAEEEYSTVLVVVVEANRQIVRGEWHTTP